MCLIANQPNTTQLKNLSLKNSLTLTVYKILSFSDELTHFKTCSRFKSTNIVSPHRREHVWHAGWQPRVKSESLPRKEVNLGYHAALTEKEAARLLSEAPDHSFIVKLEAKLSDLIACGRGSYHHHYFDNTPNPEEQAVFKSLYFPAETRQRLLADREAQLKLTRPRLFPKKR